MPDIFEFSLLLYHENLNKEPEIEQETGVWEFLFSADFLF